MNKEGPKIRKEGQDWQEGGGHTHNKTSLQKKELKTDKSQPEAKKRQMLRLVMKRRTYSENF